MRILGWARAFARRLAQQRLPRHAANASFFLLISAFPMISLLVSLLRVLPLDADAMLEISGRVLPPAAESLVEYLIRDLYAGEGAVTLSAAVALWAASRGVLALLEGVNAAYETDDNRSWLRRRLLCVLYTVGVLFALVLTLVLHVFGRWVQRLLTQALPVLDGLMTWLIPLRGLIVLLILVLLFTWMYTVFPRRRMRFLRQLPGAAAAAAGWVGFSSAFSYYVDHYSNMSVLYGSLTTVVVTMLWLYFCMNIVFFGAALNQSLEWSGCWLRREQRREPAAARTAGSETKRA